MIAFVEDAGARQEAKAAGDLYGTAYWPEVFSQLGVTGERLDPDGVPDRLAALRMLVVPGTVDLAPSTRDRVSAWVHAGGTLIGVGAGPAADLFSVGKIETVRQGCWWELAGLWRPAEHELMGPYAAPRSGECSWPIFSPLALAPGGEGEWLGKLCTAQGEDLAAPAVLWQRDGAGARLWWAFDPALTMWVLHQGRPVTEDWDGDGHMRASDLCVIPRHMSVQVPYADELLSVLANLLLRCGVPRFEMLPPLEGDKPDFLCYWGGDDEFLHNQCEASRFMAELGLPYHINVLYVDRQRADPTARAHFNFTAEDAQTYIDRQHEFSLHYNYKEDVLPEPQPPYAFDRETGDKQLKAFEETFGIRPLTTTNHWSLWTGWAEPARWMAGRGQLADNSFFHYRPERPMFAYGTAYPFFFRDDAQHDYERIPIVELPITAYEFGYSGKLGPENELTEPAEITSVVELAARYGHMVNCFLHGYRIADWKSCRAAIEEFMRQISERNLHVVHWGLDRLSRWWHERDRSRIEQCDTHLDLTVEAADGLILTWSQDGKTWSKVLPRGRHRLSLE